MSISTEKVKGHSRGEYFPALQVAIRILYNEEFPYISYTREDISFTREYKDPTKAEMAYRNYVALHGYFDDNPEKYRKEVVTIDFDNCFDKSKLVEDFVKHNFLIGNDSFILTYRFDELNKHRYKRSPTNEDLWERTKELFPKNKVIFMNTRLKGEYLAYCQNVISHVDDSKDELNSLRRYSPHVRRLFFDGEVIKDLWSLYEGHKEPVKIEF